MKTLKRVAGIISILLMFVSLSSSPANAADNIFKAALDGDASTVQVLLANGIDVNARIKDGSTVLIVASFKGDSKVVQLLLDKGADVNATNDAGFTALMMASQEGCMGAVRILLGKGADVNAKTKSETKNDPTTALILASRGSHPDMVQTLLEKGADVNAKLNDGRTALMVATNTDVRAILVKAEAASTVAAATKPVTETAGPAAAASTTVNLSGSWSFILTSTNPDKHKVQFETTLKQEGSKITGDSLGQAFSASVSEFEILFQKPPAPLSGDSVLKGKIESADKITGKIIVPQGYEAAWTWELLRNAH